MFEQDHKNLVSAISATFNDTSGQTQISFHTKSPDEASRVLEDIKSLENTTGAIRGSFKTEGSNVIFTTGSPYDFALGVPAAIRTLEAAQQLSSADILNDYANQIIDTIKNMEDYCQSVFDAEQQDPNYKHTQPDCLPYLTPPTT